MSITNLLTKLKVGDNSSIMFTNATEFPANPDSGQMCFKDQILYIYATINNISTWYPLTTVRDQHIHTQGGPATTWTVEHNFDTMNVIFIVYDDDKQVQYVSPSSQTNNVIELTFQGAEIGKCIVFAAREADTIFKIGEMFDRTTTGNDVNIYGNLIPSIDDTWNFGTTSHKWRDVYLSSATLYVGDTVTVSGTGMEVISPASPTNLSEQPLFSFSKANFTGFTYDDGSGDTVVNPSIVFNRTLEIGDNTNNLPININNDVFTITAANFSVDSSGNMSYNGAANFSEIDGGIWS